ncbi:hypothetical protein [Rhizobium sp. NLR22b]|uniref:hypothetical protein n=1 Tax=Rhizobium sp. NLR22b TaxID=2731115 RepID=UPI001C833B6A|nr:hypothetical protein [Rhizobium sp. NLR22b]MBX5240962.1 hypothetical protein [Rhizobium sp. NLR22b]
MLLATACLNVAKADELPDDTRVRAVSIFPNDIMSISPGSGTMKECRDSIAEMIEQLKQEGDAENDGQIYACLPVDQPADESIRIPVTRYKRNMFE